MRITLEVEGPVATFRVEDGRGRLVYETAVAVEPSDGTTACELGIPPAPVVEDGRLYYRFRASFDAVKFNE